MKNNRFGQAKVLDTSELDLVIKYLKTRNQKVVAATLRNTPIKFSGNWQQPRI